MERKKAYVELDSNGEMSSEGTEDSGVLPSQVRSKLAEMAALKSMPKKVYPDNISHQVEL